MTDMKAKDMPEVDNSTTTVSASQPQSSNAFIPQDSDKGIADYPFSYPRSSNRTYEDLEDTLGAYIKAGIPAVSGRFKDPVSDRGCGLDKKKGFYEYNPTADKDTHIQLNMPFPQNRNKQPVINSADSHSKIANYYKVGPHKLPDGTDVNLSQIDGDIDEIDSAVLEEFLHITALDHTAMELGVELSLESIPTKAAVVKDAKLSPIYNRVRAAEVKSLKGGRVNFIATYTDEFRLNAQNWIGRNVNLYFNKFKSVGTQGSVVQVRNSKEAIGFLALPEGREFARHPHKEEYCFIRQLGKLSLEYILKNSKPNQALGESSKLKADYKEDQHSGIGVKKCALRQNKNAEGKSILELADSFYQKNKEANGGRFFVSTNPYHKEFRSICADKINNLYNTEFFPDMSLDVAIAWTFGNGIKYASQSDVTIPFESKIHLAMLPYVCIFNDPYGADSGSPNAGMANNIFEDPDFLTARKALERTFLNNFFDELYKDGPLKGKKKCVYNALYETLKAPFYTNPATTKGFTLVFDPVNDTTHLVDWESRKLYKAPIGKKSELFAKDKIRDIIGDYNLQISNAELSGMSINLNIVYDAIKPFGIVEGDYDPKHIKGDPTLGWLNIYTPTFCQDILAGRDSTTDNDFSIIRKLQNHLYCKHHGTDTSEDQDTDSITGTSRNLYIKNEDLLISNKAKQSCRDYVWAVKGIIRIGKDLYKTELYTAIFGNAFKGYDSVEEFRERWNKELAQCLMATVSDSEIDLKKLRSIEAKLKGITGKPTIKVEAKYKEPYFVINNLTMGFTSNEVLKWLANAGRMTQCSVCGGHEVLDDGSIKYVNPNLGHVEWVKELRYKNSNGKELSGIPALIALITAQAPAYCQYLYDRYGERPPMEMADLVIPSSSDVIEELGHSGSMYSNITKLLSGIQHAVSDSVANQNLDTLALQISKTKAFQLVRSEDMNKLFQSTDRDNIIYTNEPGDCPSYGALLYDYLTVDMIAHILNYKEKNMDEYGRSKIYRSTGVSSQLLSSGITFETVENGLESDTFHGSNYIYLPGIGKALFKALGYELSCVEEFRTALQERSELFETDNRPNWKNILRKIANESNDATAAARRAENRRRLNEMVRAKGRN